MHIKLTPPAYHLYEISSFLRRTSSHFPICDSSDIRCVANESVQIIAVSPVLHSDTKSNGRISTHKIIYFIHRSTCGAGNI